MGPALHYICFVGQGPCALPRVRYRIGGRAEASDPYDIIPVFSPPLSIFPLTTVKKTV